ncbi:MAG: DNA pilot protein [Microvirus sp.]|nr:MAG: DNA pilot protein [Microvirus sp.]
MLDALSAGAGVVSAGTGILNYFNQAENLDWQKNAQKETWKREDTAVQRRVADLKAAGMSPVLAAGQAAQSSTPISTTAPQMDKKAFTDTLAYKNQSLDARLKTEQQRLLEEQIKNASVTNQLTQAQIVKLTQDILQGQGIYNHNMGVAATSGAPYAQSPAPFVKTIEGAKDVLKEYVPDSVQSAVKSFYSPTTSDPQSTGTPWMDKLLDRFGYTKVIPKRRVK